MENYRTMIRRWLLAFFAIFLVGTSTLGADKKEFLSETSLQNYLRGHELFQKDSLKEARYYLVKAIQADDQKFKAKRDMVDVEDKLHNYSSAICYVNELLEFQPYERDLWLRKVSLLRKQDNMAEADATMERMWQIFPNDSIVRSSVRNMRYRQWNERQMRSWYQQQIFDQEQYFSNHKKDSVTPDTAYTRYMALSEAYSAIGEYDNALSAIKRGMSFESLNQQKRDTLRTKMATLLMNKGLYGQALEVFNTSDKKGKEVLTYNDVLQEIAYDARLRDPYEANARLYDKTKNHDALVYLVNTSITRGYYDDALEYLKKLFSPDSEDYLKKRYGLELRMNRERAAQGVLMKLYERHPQDSLYHEDYIAMFQKLVNDDMAEGNWSEADRHLDVLQTLDSVSHELWPELIIRRMAVCGRMGNYDKALTLYQEAKDADTVNVSKYASAYEDVIATRLKTLIEEEKYEEALLMAEQLLTEVNSSEVALRTCINMAQTLNRQEKFADYAAKGYNLFPEQPYFVIKNAVSLGQQQKYEAALETIRGRLNKKDEYANPLYVATFSGITQDYANHLFGLLKKNPQFTQTQRDSINHKVLEIAGEALERDSTNKELLYTEGVALEHLKQWDSAYDRQRRFYNPANAEQREYYQHMDYLQFRSFRERVDVSYTHALYDTRQDDLASTGHLYSIATVAYSHLDSLDTYTGQVSYKGIDGYHDGADGISGGAGLELMAQWEHQFSHRWSGMVNGSYSTRYFNKWGANASVAYAADKGWTPALRVGYRRTPETYLYLSATSKEAVENEKYHLFIVSPSIEKSWKDDRIKTTLNADVATMKSGVYYNVGLKGKLFFNEDNISSVSLITGFGSFPELSFFEQTALRNVSHTNSMVGFDVQVLCSSSFYIGLAGSWNTCYNPYWDANGVLADSYRNIYSITAQLHVAF